MRLLFDLGHPAHVHLFRNLIKRSLLEGGEVFATTREKDVTVRLCQEYGIPQVVLSRANPGQLLAGFAELVLRTFRLLRIARKFKPDALLGTSMSIGTVGRLINCPSFVFNEDDAGVVPLFAHVAYRTSSYVVTPACLKHEDYGPTHLTYGGYHELAYLHPENFKPNPAIPHSMGLRIDKPYFVLRFVSLKAHHDLHASGLPVQEAGRLVRLLAEHGRVLITSEEELQDEFKPYQFPLPPHLFHDVLAFASMVIGDSQTVTAEAAVLGVPCLRCNTFVGRITYLEELEKRFELTKGFLPSETENLILTVQEWLADLDNVKRDMQRKRDNMLKICVNLTDWQWRMLCEKLYSPSQKGVQGL
jgi:predicted glycosyltransferase